ncbi:MAG: Peptidoglycan-associated lipoprotein [Chlamydiae bacterium]|nr:Peptidoglycan-associated lipoprotein [Chlamydiota bacterium]
MSGCGNRSSTSMWENTKTASRYIGRGLKAFGGGGKDSRLIHYQYEFQGPEDAKYIALHEEGESDDTKSFPLAREVPGEMDSFLPGIEGFHNPVSKEATVFQNVHFDTNRDQVQGQNDIQIIKAISKFMKKNPNYYIYLEGHCDQRGTALYNMSLGSRRGNTVRNILIENGVDLDRLFTVSYGKEKLIDGSNNPAAWEKNRRVQFKLYKKN